MASIAYNIEQITHFDIQNLPSIDKNGTEYAKYEFKKIKINDEGKEITTQFLVSKLGYCCEPKGIGSWIYLYLEEQPETAVPIQIGKSGMYEVQPEPFLKLNEENIIEEIDMKVNIIAVEVPKNLKFVLDYAYKI